MSHLMIDGLADNVICELLARWNTTGTNNVDTATQQQLALDLYQILCVVDATKFSCRLLNVECTTTVCDVLQQLDEYKECMN